VVSLGIIPLQTATRLFGLKPTPQPQPRPVLSRDRKPGSRHTRLSHSDQSSALGTSSTSTSSPLTNPRSLHGWHTRKTGTPSSSIDSTSRTGSSLPGTPRNRHRASLPPLEAQTDSEHVPHRPRDRHATAPAASSSLRLVNVPDPSSSISASLGVSEEGGGVVVEEDEGVEGETIGDDGRRRTRSRSRVDHSTRRILFVDPKAARRQTAPVIPTQSQPPLVSGVEIEGRTAMTDSPVQDSIALPNLAGTTRMDDHPQRQQPPPSSNPVTLTDRPKSTTDSSHSRPVTNEFGEFVSAPIPAPDKTRFSGDHERDAVASGAESISERKSRFKGGFKLFTRKRSSSVTSNGESPSMVHTPNNAESTPKGSSKNGSNKLRRKSPYPARPDSHNRSSTEAIHKYHFTGTASVAGPSTVTVSDAEACSTSWLRSRPKKLTRRARSNSLSERPHTKQHTTPIAPSEPTSSRHRRTATSASVGSIPPLPRTSTIASASTSTSTSTSSANPSSAPGTHHHTSAKRSSTLGGISSFNPLRELEARLYYRHGVGTGPNTADVSSYVTTPVPKTGIKRTNPYALLGVEPPSRASPAPGLSRSNLASGKMPAPPRRASAPAGGGEEDENKPPSKRLDAASRAHTQPL